MRKLFAVLKIGFKNAVVYRTDFFLWGFNEFLNTLIFLFIWIFIFGERNRIGGFTLPETVTYLIGTGLITNVVSTWVSHHIERDVQSGWLSNLLIKPLSYPRSRLYFSVSSKPVNLLIRTLVYLGLAIFYQSKIVITTDFATLSLVVISIGIAFVISYLVDFLIGCMAFWTTTTEGVIGIFQTINRIFSGSFAPISFFPAWFQSLASALPFFYIQYFPMLIYLKKVSMIEAIKGIGIQIVWVLVLYGLAKFVWRKGIRKYEGVGI